MTVGQTWPPSGVPAIIETCCVPCWIGGAGPGFFPVSKTFAFSSIWYPGLISGWATGDHGFGQQVPEDHDESPNGSVPHSLATNGDPFVYDVQAKLTWRWGMAHAANPNDPTTWPDASPSDIPSGVTLTWIGTGVGILNASGTQLGGTLATVDTVDAWNQPWQTAVNIAGSQSAFLRGATRMSKFHSGSSWFGLNWVSNTNRLTASTTGVINSTSAVSSAKASWAFKVDYVVTLKFTQTLDFPLTCHLGSPVLDSDVTIGSWRYRKFHRGPWLP